MRKTEYESDTMTMHNGVMGKGTDKFSDTMLHIKSLLAPLAGMIDDKKFADIFTKLSSASSNRWIIAAEKATLLIGDWEEFEGSYYSNTSYEKVKSWKKTSIYNEEERWKDGTGYNNWYKPSHSEKGSSTKHNSILDGECPSCGEMEFLAPSLYSVYKARCYVCGAVYDPITNNISFFVPINDISAF